MKRLSVLCLGLAMLTFGCGSSNSGTAAIGRPHDQGFVVLDMQLKKDNLGNLSGRAQVQNTTSHVRTAAMQFTFRENGHAVAHGMGLARAVGVGQTVTVDVNSTDQWDGKPLTYTVKVTDLY